jgi:hypothetical protein
VKLAGLEAAEVLGQGSVELEVNVLRVFHHGLLSLDDEPGSVGR